MVVSIQIAVYFVMLKGAVGVPSDEQCPYSLHKEVITIILNMLGTEFPDYHKSPVSNMDTHSPLSSLERL